MNIADHATCKIAICHRLHLMINVNTAGNFYLSENNRNIDFVRLFRRHVFRCAFQWIEMAQIAAFNTLSGLFCSLVWFYYTVSLPRRAEISQKSLRKCLRWTTNQLTSIIVPIFGQKFWISLQRQDAFRRLVPEMEEQRYFEACEAKIKCSSA